MFGGRAAQLTPPLKGSFPLDYHQTCRLETLNYLCCLKTCRLETLNYLCCLKEAKGHNSECRTKASDYFRCRMDNGLMDREEWPKLGFKEFELSQQQQQQQQNDGAGGKTD
uniref:Cytochrome c oxidase assembly protein COX19 n=1 Tax=Globodera pallida TaxID=36090 RepID=A0A183C394_GLOPA